MREKIKQTLFNVLLSALAVCIGLLVAPSKVVSDTAPPIQNMRCYSSKCSGLHNTVDQLDNVCTQFSNKVCVFDDSKSPQGAVFCDTKIGYDCTIQSPPGNYPCTGQCQFNLSVNCSTSFTGCLNPTPLP